MQAQDRLPTTLCKHFPSAQVCISRLSDKILTQCTFNNVTPGTKYTFYAQALNSGGWGDKSAASNEAAAFNLKIVKFNRTKILFGLGGQKPSVEGAAPGYANGTKLTPWVQVGSNGKWEAQKPGTATVSGEKFGWSMKVPRSQANSDVSVKFTADGENFSNIVKIPPAK